MSPSQPGVLIIGVGNTLRGDDGAGQAVVEALKARGLPGAQLVTCQGDGLLLIEAWKHASKVILIDAAISGATPGTVYRFDTPARPLPADFSFSSTHVFGIAETIELARALDQLPLHLVIFAIEGENFAVGAALSLKVECAVHEVVEQVINETHSVSKL